MPSTYSTRLRFELIGTGEQSGNWGNTTNVNLGTLVEEAITGIGAVTVADAGNTDLTAINGGTDQSRNMILNLTGALTGTRTVRCPNVQKMYFVRNGTSGGQSVVFRPLTGNGVTIPNGRVRAVYCDGTDVLDLITDLPLGVRAAGVEIATISDTQTLTNKTLTAPRVGTAILDTNGNESIRIAATASAVNDILVTNAASSGTPTISAVGDDTNVGLNLVSKGSGQVFANSLPVVTTTAAQTVSNKTISSSTIDSSNTITNAVATASIQNNAVTEAKIADGNVTVNKLGNSSVTAIKIADGNVTEAKIADGNVTVNKLGNSSVTAIKIADGTVTQSKMAAGSVGTGQILDGNVTDIKIADGNVTANKIGTNAVTESKIADGNVTVNKIGNGQVTEAKIADGNVTVNKIGNGQVTEIKIADGNVTANKIGNGAVTEAKIADGSVTVNKIGNSQVTPEKLSQPKLFILRAMSGSFQDITGIPSWVSRVTIGFDSVSFTASGAISTTTAMVQLGTAAGVQGSGYVFGTWNGSGWYGEGTGQSNGFWLTGSQNNTGGHYGHVHITRGAGNDWAFSVAMYTSPWAYLTLGGGKVSLSGTMDRIRIALSAGSATFDSGVVSIHLD